MMPLKESISASTTLLNAKLSLGSIGGKPLLFWNVLIIIISAGLTVLLWNNLLLRLLMFAWTAYCIIATIIYERARLPEIKQ